MTLFCDCGESYGLTFPFASKKVGMAVMPLASLDAMLKYVISFPVVSQPLAHAGAKTSNKEPFFESKYKLS